MTVRWTVMFGGFGGQGIVLSSVVLGLAAVYDGKYATQRASYGSEARGGRCRSEVIISDEEISYPLIDHLGILVVMSQQAFDSYLDELEPSGDLFFDPDMVRGLVRRRDINTLKIPAANTADKLGNRIVANMVMLGALRAMTEIVSKDALQRSVKDSVAPTFYEIDLRALEEGERIMRNLIDECERSTAIEGPT
jgi:2-oxoglutarate ferredoxin oxidoreductase subunit gamma